MSKAMTRANEAWAGEVPAYVKAIIQASEAPSSSQKKVSDKLGYSATVISQVISNTYPGDLERVAAQVRINLMGSKVPCPAIGDILEADCIDWQQKATALTSAAPHVVRMFRACRGCKRFTGDAK